MDNNLKAISEAAKKKMYSNLLQKIKRGENLTASELKAFHKIDSEINGDGERSFQKEMKQLSVNGHQKTEILHQQKDDMSRIRKADQGRNI